MPSFLVQVQPECTSHDDCGDPQICHQGSCQNACRFQQCGANAICSASRHVARCECLPGYRGDNPNRECRKRKWTALTKLPLTAAKTNNPCSLPARPTEPSLASGCADNTECPDYAACENRLCINPCAVRDPCAPLATCRVVGHEPVCTCPDGFVGSPTTECRPRE